MTAHAERLPAPRVSERRLRWSPKLFAGVLLVAGFVVLGLSHPVLQSTVWSDESRVYHPVIGH